MTDKEITKALEYCPNEGKETCRGCPLLGDKTCVQTLQKCSLDLINRQKAEIEGLKISVEALSRKVATARNKTV